jgi:exosortase
MSVWHNVHGISIPFVVAYLIYRDLRTDQSADTEQSACGFLFLIAGLGIIVLDSAIRTQLLSAFGMIVCLPALSLLILGSRRTKGLAFVWVLSFFMLPIPAAFIERFNLVLRRISAAGTEQFLSLLGMPVYRMDTELFLPKSTLLVSDACSGFSPLYASVTLALVLAYLNPSWSRRLLILAAVFPIAISCNVLRVMFLAVITNRWGGGVLDTPLHQGSGILAAITGMILLLFLGRVGKTGSAA